MEKDRGGEHFFAAALSSKMEKDCGSELYFAAALSSKTEKDCGSEQYFAAALSSKMLEIVGVSFTITEILRRGHTGELLEIIDHMRLVIVAGNVG